MLYFKSEHLISSLAPGSTAGRTGGDLCPPTPTPKQQQVWKSQVSGGARQLPAALPAFSRLWTEQQDGVTRAPSLCHHSTQKTSPEASPTHLAYENLSSYPWCGGRPGTAVTWAVSVPVLGVAPSPNTVSTACAKVWGVRGALPSAPVQTNSPEQVKFPGPQLAFSCRESFPARLW